MDVETHLLTLQRKLGCWLETIRRATCADDVRIAAARGASFRLVATWRQGSETRELARAFTPARIEQEGARRACDHARAFIAEVLALRGIVS
jgi:hypothetical protein